MGTEHRQAESADRRTFLAAAAVAAGATVTAATVRASRNAPRVPPPPQQDGVDALTVMQRDLERALAKPVADRGWGMVIDTRKCIGCDSCVVACIAENTLPPGVAYRRVPEVETGTYPNVKRVFMPTNCYQCDNPPCKDAAPDGAITKRPDGIVEFHYELLRDPTVARAVAEACPYNAVSYDEGGAWTEGTPASQPYETLDAPEYGREWDRAGGELPALSARKCHFCLHRLEQGRLPACVTTCVGRAMYFGDFNDLTSTVSLLAREGPGLRMLAQRGTQPRIVHLTSDPATCQACHGN